MLSSVSVTRNNLSNANLSTKWRQKSVSRDSKRRKIETTKALLSNKRSLRHVFVKKPVKKRPSLRNSRIVSWSLSNITRTW